MNFLHNREEHYVLHLDLKADNVLVDDDLHAILTDFGLSELKTVSKLSMMQSTRRNDESCNQKGTLLYVSPEHLNDPRHRATRKTDVYAFGILAWQILADATPYEDLNIHDINFILHHIQTLDYRPSLEMLPPYVQDTSFVTNVVEKSWSKTPEQRPNFNDILGEIRKEIDGYPYFHSNLTEAVKYARQVVQISEKESPKGEISHHSSSAPPSHEKPIYWRIVSDGIQQRGGISRLHYGEFSIVGNTEFYFHGLKMLWKCKCMDLKTGHTVSMSNFKSPSGACKHAASQLVREMIGKGIYPRPIDEENLS